MILECVHLPKCAIVSPEEFSSDIPFTEPSTLSYLIARVIDNGVHDCRIEPKDNDLWMLELLIEAERIGEPRSIRIPRDHVHKPSVLFTSLKNALVVIA